MTQLDPRIHAFRDDIADKALEGLVSAAHFVSGEKYIVQAPSVYVMSKPHENAQILTQALCGEAVMIFEEKDGFAWGQLVNDGYVGYLPAEALSQTAHPPACKIIVAHTHLYPEPDIKTQPLSLYHLGSVLSGTVHDDKFFKTQSGAFIIRAHLAPLDMLETDFVHVAEKYIGVPYLWGGKTSYGLDCSGLIQIALQAAGIKAPRDSDMQAAQLGRVLERDERATLKRGDLVFWRGHVGVMCDDENLLHANGHHMMVVKEPFARAVKRISEEYGDVTQINRL